MTKLICTTAERTAEKLLTHCNASLPCPTKFRRIAMRLYHARQILRLYDTHKTKTMYEKFKNKFRIQTSRLQNYDYSQNGMYFVTICTKNREEFFGEIVDGKMIFNEIGKIVKEEWSQTPIIRQDIILDEWTIMPNHLHGIIEIKNELTRDDILTCRDALQCVSTDVNQYKNKFGPQRNNLSSIIRGFKGATTKRCHMCNLNFTWQSRFYDANGDADVETPRRGVATF